MQLTIRHAGLAALTCLAVAACGSQTDNGGPASSPAPSATSSSTPGSPAFPLTVTRNGGIAGFDDVLVVKADGSATLSRRGRSSSCQIEAKTLAAISAASTQVDWRALPATPPPVQHPDDMITAVAANGGVAELSDVRVKPLRDPLSQLLIDAGAPADKRKLCR